MVPKPNAERSSRAAPALLIHVLRTATNDGSLGDRLRPTPRGSGIVDVRIGDRVREALPRSPHGEGAEGGPLALYAVGHEHGGGAQWPCPGSSGSAGAAEQAGGQEAQLLFPLASGAAELSVPDAYRALAEAGRHDWLASAWIDIAVHRPAEEEGALRAAWCGARLRLHAFAVEQEEGGAPSEANEPQGGAPSEAKEPQGGAAAARSLDVPMGVLPLLSRLELRFVVRPVSPAVAVPAARARGALAMRLVVAEGIFDHDGMWRYDRAAANAKAARTGRRVRDISTLTRAFDFAPHAPHSRFVAPLGSVYRFRCGTNMVAWAWKQGAGGKRGALRARSLRDPASAARPANLAAAEGGEGGEGGQTIYTAPWTPGAGVDATAVLYGLKNSRRLAITRDGRPIQAVSYSPLRFSYYRLVVRGAGEPGDLPVAPWRSHWFTTLVKKSFVRLDAARGRILPLAVPQTGCVDSLSDDDGDDEASGHAATALHRAVMLADLGVFRVIAEPGTPEYHQLISERAAAADAEREELAAAGTDLHTWIGRIQPTNHPGLRRRPSRAKRATQAGAGAERSEGAGSGAERSEGAGSGSERSEGAGSGAPITLQGGSAEGSPPEAKRRRHVGVLHGPLVIHPKDELAISDLQRAQLLAMLGAPTAFSAAYDIGRVSALEAAPSGTRGSDHPTLPPGSLVLVIEPSAERRAPERSEGAAGRAPERSEGAQGEALRAQSLRDELRGGPLGDLLILAAAAADLAAERGGYVPDGDEFMWGGFPRA